MTADVALKVAMAAGRVLSAAHTSPNTRSRVVIGKDTRLSGYMLEQALSAGFLSMGLDVVLLGPMPTPAVAQFTRSLRADLGVMISASHNPYEDNGIKLFGADGYKLSDDIENAIEDYIDTPTIELASPERMGRASRLDDAAGRYIEFIKSAFPKGLTLSGLRIVIDCANGAAYRVAPQVLWELEAEVIAIGTSPNGVNINAGCGATDTNLLQKTVIETGAHLGIALDGDADRLIMVDNHGEIVDGDRIMGLIAQAWHESGQLKGGALVSTVMSNLGLERYLNSIGIKLIRTAVGDRYVMEQMREGGYNVGGEQSGHMVLSDYATTGDGLLAALQILAIMQTKGETLANLAHIFTPVPQILQNIRYNKGESPLDNPEIKAAIAHADAQLQSMGGRLLVRASGTEPLIRVMAEGDNQAEIESVVGALCAIIQGKEQAA